MHWRGRRGTDNGRQKTRNHGYDVIVGELFTDYSDHPHNDNALLKLKSTGAGRFTSFFPVGGIPMAAWPERLLSEEMGTLWHCNWIKERGALPIS